MDSNEYQIEKLNEMYCFYKKERLKEIEQILEEIVAYKKIIDIKKEYLTFDDIESLRKLVESMYEK
jgi:hypothetical protein